jgi:DNA-binding MarR family transcriptional regulator
MPELVPKLNEGFGPANRLRIYRGEPALVNGHLPSRFLKEPEIETAYLTADGLSQEEIGEEMNVKEATVSRRLQRVNRHLGIVERHQLAGFFPLDPEDEIVQGKNLADLKIRPRNLRILQALSVAKPYEMTAREEKITRQTVARNAYRANDMWPDTRNPLDAIRVANAIRARYVEAIEAQPEAAVDIRVRTLTLPVLIELEPRILGELMPGPEVADLTQAA